MKKSYLYIAILMFSISVLLMAISFKNSFALPTDWYSDYDISWDEDNLTATLTKYNGTDTEVFVPSTLVKDDKTYKVYVIGNNSSSKSLFANNTNITKVTFESGIKAGIRLSYLFYDCINLEEVYFNDFDTSETAAMISMFDGCSKLHTVDMSSFTSESLTNIHYMFDGTAITKIHLGNFNFLYTDSTTDNHLDYLNSKNSYIFGRGTWRRLEDGKDYSIAEIVYNSGRRDISGTYVYQSGIAEEMFINYNVTYRIEKIDKIDEYDFSVDNVFEIEDNALYIKDMTQTATNDYAIPGSATLLMKDVVTDINNNTYNLRVTIDNIHLYDLNISGPASFKHYLFTVGGSNGISVRSLNYDENSTRVYQQSSSKYDVTLEIVDDNGVPQEGSYVFSASDLDVPTYIRTTRPALYQYSSTEGWGNYSEGVELLEGFDESTIKMFPFTTLEKNGDRIYGTRYDKSTELSEFSVKANASRTKFTWTGENCGTFFLNLYQPTFVNLEKHDDKGNNLAGALLELYSDDLLVDSWTSTNEVHKLFLNPGYYTLKETTVPNNYVGGSDINFYVDIVGKIIIDAKEVNSVIMKNTGKPVRVIVNYIDETTGENIDQITDNSKKYYDEYTSTEKSFDNYVLIRKPEEETVILDKDETVLNYYYVKISSGVLEKHLDIADNKVLYTKAHTGNVGDDYNIPSKTFEGYDLVTDRLPDNNTGKMKEEIIEVVYYYKQKSEIKVKYIDKDTNKPLDEDIVIKGYVNDEYNTEKKNFDGYVFVESTGETSGQLNKDNEDVIYYYVRMTSGVIEKHVDIADNKVLSSETHTGHVGDDYNIPSKTFEGYDLVTDRLPNNNVGKIKEETIEVVYYYKQRAKVKVKYIDKESGEPLAEDVNIDGYVNDDYQTEQKKFPGYEFIEVKGDTSGKIKALNEDVIYYYKKVLYITTEVNGNGGTITGDETVDYHGDSTEDNIIIEANEGYFIRRITINGEEIEIADDNKMILSNFRNMEENKHVVVEFESLTPDVPKTDINSIMPIIGIISMLIGVLFVFLSSKRKSVSTI